MHLHRSFRLVGWCLLVFWAQTGSYNAIDKLICWKYSPKTSSWKYVSYGQGTEYALNLTMCFTFHGPANHRDPTVHYLYMCSMQRSRALPQGFRTLLLIAWSCHLSNLSTRDDVKWILILFASNWFWSRNAMHKRGTSRFRPVSYGSALSSSIQYNTKWSFS